MSRSAAGKHRSRARSGPAVALFPFLAVLVCTMGAMIVVLVVVARQSQLQAVEEAASHESEAEKELEAARELVQWRIGEMGGMQEKAKADLAQARLKLGSIEAHAQELQQEFARLEAAWKEMNQSGEATPERRTALEAELARLKRQIAESRQQLEEAKTKSQSPQKSYAVLPYEGPNGTRRIPMILECRADKIILQPEGIEFVIADFEEPLEAGNPLDRALRAVRESLLRQGRIRGDGSDEPYPYLVVRSDGIAGYYAARAALKSWQDVGYDLIDEDGKLPLPPADPVLAKNVLQVVMQARLEQQHKRTLMAMAGGRGSRPGYRGVPGGGGVAPAGRAEGKGSSEPAPRYRAAPGGGIIRDDGQPIEGPDRRTAKASPRRGSHFTPGEASTGTVAGAEKRPAARKSAEDVISRPRSSQQDVAAAQDSQGQPLRPGEWSPRSNQRGPSGDSSEQEESKSKKSLAEMRGQNWGLPDATRGATPLARPIRVTCRPDRLEIYPEHGDVPSQVIPIERRPEEFVDAFVSAVWDHMEPWGIAGRGMYWRPVLQTTVVPGADARFEEIQSLLDGSGLDVRRAEGRQAQAAPQPHASTRR